MKGIPQYITDEDVWYPHDNHAKPPPTIVDGVTVEVSFNPYQCGTCVKFQNLPGDITNITLCGDDANEIIHLVLGGSRTLQQAA